jgi:hypothetical protein
LRLCCHPEFALFDNSGSGARLALTGARAFLARWLFFVQNFYDGVIEEQGRSHAVAS